MTVKFGICNWTSARLQAPQACEWAASLGLQGLQLDLGAFEENFPLSQSSVQNEWRNEAEKHSITLCSLMINAVMAYNLLAEDGSRDAEIAWQALERGVETAHAMQLPLMIIPSFRKSAINTDSELEKTAEYLKKICRIAQPFGISIASENVLSPADMKKMALLVSEPNFYLYLDGFNYSFWKGTPLSDWIEELLPYSCNEFHVKDGSTTATGSLPLGRGIADLPGSFSTLQKHGFDGWVFLENFYERPTFVTGGIDTEALIRQDLAFLQQRFNQ